MKVFASEENVYRISVNGERITITMYGLNIMSTIKCKVTLLQHS